MKRLHCFETLFLYFAERNFDRLRLQLSFPQKMAMTIEGLLGLLLCFQLVYCYKFCWVSGLEKGKQTFSGKGLVVRGLCIIQQLVANAFSSHVCPGANALFILRRGIDSVSNQPRWWRHNRFLIEVTGCSGNVSWIGAAKFLTGASAVGSFAIPIVLRHAHMISTGAMFIEFTSFIIFVCTVLCFHRASLEDDWY
ncbi:hypothetical protein CRYUN_Cryun05aG0217000 [Craigia yunnanensis]